MKWHHGLIALGAIALSACGESQTASTDADSLRRDKHQFGSGEQRNRARRPERFDLHNAGHNEPDRVPRGSPGDGNDAAVM